MKRISFYLFVIVFLGGLFVGFWAWQKYVKTSEPKVLQFAAELGDLRELVKVRGEVAAQKEYEMEFPFLGIVERVYVQEGQSVPLGAPLMSLETTLQTIELNRFRAAFTAKEQNVAKLLSGATREDIRILESKLSGAERALVEAKKNLMDKLQ